MSKGTATYEVSTELEGVTSSQLSDSVWRILKSNNLCTIATVTPEKQPYMNTAFFVPLGEHEVAIWTSPKTKHSTNASADPSAAITIFDSTQTFGKPLAGLQATGTLTAAGVATTIKAFAQYTKRYASFSTFASSVDEMNRAFESRFYIFKIQWVKVLDELAFGSEGYVTGKVL